MVIPLHLNIEIKLLKTLEDDVASKLIVRRNGSRPIQEDNPDMPRITKIPGLINMLTNKDLM